jgi:colicin import membrane protein
MAMSTGSMHLELAPPPAQGLGRSLSLALVVHLLLLIALTWGIQWQHMDNTPAVEAELWSALPKAAAPPPPPPAPEPTPEPPPPPLAPKLKPTPPPPSRDADIAIAKQKKAEQEQKLAQEQLKLKKQAEQKDKEKALEQQRQREKEKLAQDQRDKKELAVKEQKEKERKDKERKAQEAKSAAQEERKLQAMRDENMRRMAGMAGASGSPSATGDALRASGPSASYGGRIIARVKPNIVFNPDDVSGNPVAEVEVRTAPDGKIMSRKLIKSSGNKAWDEAVIKALDKTDTLPRDTDGTIPTMMVLGFKPRD